MKFLIPEVLFFIAAWAAIVASVFALTHIP